jgi:hypothetical protein
MNLCAETTLSGKIGNMDLDSTGNPYIVSDNITVGEGKTLTIGPGCVLLFKEYTGIDVSGDLTVQGTAARPVVFTSHNDNKWNSTSEKQPEAFDWNGIRILTGGRAVLSRFLVSYSVYGIQAQSEDIVINEGVFNQNGQFNFTLSGKILAVQENLPFTYQDLNDTKKSATNRRALRIAAPVACGVGCVGFGIGAVFFLQRKSHYHDEYLATHSLNRMSALLEKEETARNRAVVCSIAAGVLLPVTVGLTVYVGKPDRKLTLLVQPQLGTQYAGLIVGGRF